MTTTNPVTVLDRTIRAKYPVIAISSQEETRVEDAARAIANKQGKLLFAWTAALGLLQLEGERAALPEADETRDPNAALAMIYKAAEFCGDRGALFLVKDLHGYLTDPTVLRWVRDIAGAFQKVRYTLILLSPNFSIPADLEKDVALIDWPLPNTQELEQIVGDCVASLPEGVPNKLNGSKDRVVRALTGLTAFEAANVLSMAIVTNKELSEKAIPLIIAEKKAIVRKSGYLEFFDADVSFADIGGAAKLKEYTRQARAAFSKEAQAFGLPSPRGVLLVGVPGAGKSLMAKAATNGEVPLLRLDIGALFGGLVGQSEGNARAALKLAEAIGACVLWIDEIDKGMAGMGGSDNDGGTSRRVLGTILTWMQEHKSQVYVFATANDVSYLVNKMPEMLRRFDDLWWVDLPNKRERIEIAAIHLAKRSRKPADFDLEAIASATAEFTGAEIEKVIASALRACFVAGRDIATADVVAAAKSAVPVARTMGDNLTALRAWARTSARWASEPEEETATPKGGTGRQVELD